MELLLAVSSGLILGMIHAFDIDHVVAVTAFATNNPDPKKAATFGVAWGLGHTSSLLLLGGISLIFRFVIPAAVEDAAEMAVGLFLIAIGSWVLIDLFRRRHIHIHRHLHDGYGHFHFHSHEKGPHHHHRHSMFIIGATHGFAGTASIMVLLPVTLSQSLFTAAVYLILFGAGTMIAMGGIAFILGTAALNIRSKNLLPFVRGASGLVSLTVGLFWIGEKIFS